MEVKRGGLLVGQGRGDCWWDCWWVGEGGSSVADWWERDEEEENVRSRWGESDIVRFLGLDTFLALGTKGRGGDFSRGGPGWMHTAVGVRGVMGGSLVFDSNVRSMCCNSRL